MVELFVAGAALSLPADRLQLAEDLLCSSGLGQFSVDLAGAGREKLAAAVQASGISLRHTVFSFFRLSGVYACAGHRRSAGVLVHIPCCAQAVSNTGLELERLAASVEVFASSCPAGNHKQAWPHSRASTGAA